MSLKQCVCGRSLIFPYCDGSHNIKKDENVKKVEKEK